MERSFKYKWLVAAAGMLVIGFVVWYFHTIIFYILASFILSLIGHPLVKKIENFKIKGWSAPRWLAAMITLMVLIFVILVAMWSLIPMIVAQVHNFSTVDFSNLNQVLQEPAMKLENWVNGTFPMADFSVKETLVAKISPILHSGVLQNMFSSITTFFTETFVALFSIFFITFFFLKDEQLFNEGIVMIFPKKYEKNIIRAISSSVNLLVRYFIGIFIESLIKFILVGFALYFLGMDFQIAMLIGLVTAVLNVIPYVGPLVGGVIAFIIAIMSPEAHSGATLTEISIEIFAVLMVFQFIDNIILQPYIYSSSVKAHPLEIFIVILMAGYIAGVLGMLLAIPTYTVLRVFAKEFFANLRVVRKLTENL